MRPEQRRQLDKLFHAALERNPAERGAFLDEACAGDEALLKLLEALLAAHEASGSFIERPAMEDEAQGLAADETLEIGLAKGELVSHYSIIAPLGVGGMGQVYLAQDITLGRKVALKLLPALVTEDIGRLRRFEQEARSASALNHPNIITVYEIGKAGSAHFIVTEFIDGVTLRQHMAGRLLQLGEALDIAVQVASALVAAHAKGIVHRDVKPENIMVQKENYAAGQNHIKVLDFGIAKLMERPTYATESEATTRMLVKTEKGIVIGTPSYMSPEQVGAEALDGRSDIFSFGIVLYEMLSGQQPFVAKSSVATASAILTLEPPPLGQLSREVPAELERIVGKALRKNPDERYQTAKDLLIDLRQLKKHSEFSAELERSVSRNKRADDAETKTSIAVLPFANMSADAENEYFCDGLAEELLNALAKIGTLKVVARTSAFSFKGKNVNVSEIGNALSVKTVLEGSVRKAGNRVRITLQLVNAGDGYHIWSDSYDREMKDIFDVQDEITLAVVDALKVKLLGEKSGVLKRYTDNTEAYELYLKGRYHLHKHTGEGWLKAIEFFERAIEEAPEYAPAYACLSSVLAFCSLFGVLLADETVTKWKAATVRALEIDDNLDEAHTAFGQLRFYYEWNWEEAEREYLRATEINPNNAEAHHHYGLFLVRMEQFGEAINEGLRALELDPLSLLGNLQVGWIYLHAGRLDDVMRLDRKMLEIEPNFHGAYWQMGIACVAKGTYEEALEAFRKALALGSYQHVLSSIGAVCADLGRRDEALDMLDQLFQMRQQQLVPAYNIARIYSCLGEIDKAIEWLEKAVEERNGEMVFLNVETKAGTGSIFGKKIRQDARFQDILRRIETPL